ncbi:MAG: S1/P1 nuclease [Akkermansiaceae bacterium]|nr:S1/P1 nuclease [Armatimonadota bacterium]
MHRFPLPRLRVATLLVNTLLITASLSLLPAARAWNATGHMTITAIAETRLSDEAKKNTSRLIPMVTDTRTPDLLTSSVWMDNIRADGVRLYDRWHYSNHAHSPDGTPFPEKPHTDDVAWAVEQNIKVLQSEKASDGDKARSLRFLIHTVEDAHNPLHSGSRYTKEMPDGDSGGNGFTLEDVPYARNLHSLWDGALGTFARGEGPLTENEDKARALAVTLTTRFPESSLPESSVLDPQKWMEEGAVFLKTVVYPAATTPDTKYMETCRPIAERQAVLAGYRLAKILNAIWPAASEPSGSK